MKKKVVGLTEQVKVIGKKEVSAIAKFDTGASRSCVDEKVAINSQLGPVIKFVKVKSATAKGFVRRPVFKAKLKIKGKEIPVKVSVANRKELKQDVLIGRDVIRSNFIVDLKSNNKTKTQKSSKRD